jgi:hypothetical protein
VVTGGQVLAITDDGRNFRGFSAETGRSRLVRQAVGGGNQWQEGQMILSMTDASPQTVLRLAGSYVYAWNPQSIAAFNLERPGDQRWQQNSRGRGEARLLLLGRDYTVVLGRPPGEEVATEWTLSAVLRGTPALPSGAESGRLVYTPKFTDSHGIIAWQMIDGGLCYLSGDHVLHTLRGNRNPSGPPSSAAPRGGAQ